MAFQWYAIQTYAGSEQAVKRGIEQLAADYGLEDKIEKIVVPTEEVIEVKNGEKKITERTLYSGYVFAQIDLDTDLWHKIQSLPRVSRFIGEQKTPTPLTEADIKVILDKRKLPHVQRSISKQAKWFVLSMGRLQTLLAW